MFQTPELKKIKVIGADLADRGVLDSSVYVVKLIVQHAHKLNWITDSSQEEAFFLLLHS